MSVDVLLAAHVCEYCGAGTTLVTDLDGDLVCAEGTGCAAPVATTRIAGCVVPVEALMAPEPRVPTNADAALLLAGDELDAEAMTERERMVAAASLRAEARRLGYRIAHAAKKLAAVPSAASLSALDSLSVEARTAVETLVAWERRCHALRMGHARAAQRKGRA